MSFCDEYCILWSGVIEYVVIRNDAIFYKDASYSIKSEHIASVSLKVSNILDVISK